MEERRGDGMCFSPWMEGYKKEEEWAVLYTVQGGVGTEMMSCWADLMSCCADMMTCCAEMMSCCAAMMSCCAAMMSCCAETIATRSRLCS
jgi:hypothetical protein